ncbi:hypothetical protein ABT373_24170 [Streptomyces sp. NPDC000070]|uniref:hypothetical protein n=1 Tax=Streptomyces sp. NPDC000070 TaxID=3154240 RepID=UPI0033177EE7
MGQPCTSESSAPPGGDIEWKSVDVLNTDGIAAILPGPDVLISGFQPGNAAKDLADTVRRSMAEPGRVLADSDELLHATLDELGLPRGTPPRCAAIRTP